MTDPADYVAADSWFGDVEMMGANTEKHDEEDTEEDEGTAAGTVVVEKEDEGTTAGAVVVEEEDVGTAPVGMEDAWRACYIAGPRPPNHPRTLLRMRPF